MKERDNVRAIRVADTPAQEPIIVGCAVCSSAKDFVEYRQTLGNPTCAVVLFDDETEDRWFFTNEFQDAVLFALDWHKRNYALEQFIQPQTDGDFAYAYRIRGLNNKEIEQVLYEPHLWRAATGDPEDVNREASPQVLALLRLALCRFLAEDPLGHFLVLDFSQPDRATQYLNDWC